jgi:plastocyanin
MSTRLAASLLFLFVLTIPGCGGDNSTGSGSNSQVVTVAIRDNFFEPKSITIQAGTTVRWVMQGSMTNHTVTENNNLFDSGLRFINAGDAFERTFVSADNDKVFLYHCEAHWISDEMQGSIRVGANAPDPPPRY